MELNADFSQRAVVHAATMPWATRLIVSKRFHARAATSWRSMGSEIASSEGCSAVLPKMTPPIDVASERSWAIQAADESTGM